MKTRVWVGRSVSRPHKTWSRSLLFKDFLETEPKFERAETLVSRNACNGENGKNSREGWRFKLDAKSGPLESGDFGEIGDLGKNGKFGWRKIARGLAIQIRWQKWPFEEWRWRLIAVSVKYAIFAKIATFGKGPFAISFEFLFTIRRLIAISAIFAKYAIACISGHNHDVNNTVPAMSTEPCHGAHTTTVPTMITVPTKTTVLTVPVPQCHDNIHNDHVDKCPRCPK